MKDGNGVINNMCDPDSSDNQSPVIQEDNFDSIKPGQEMLEESQRHIGQFYNKKFSTSITKYEQSRRKQLKKDRKIKLDEFGKTVDFDNESLEPDFVYEKKAEKIKQKAQTNLNSNRSKTT